MNDANLIDGGGAVVDVARIQKPKTVGAIVAQIGNYVSTMNLLRKPCSQVVVSVDQHSKLMAAVKKGRDEKEPAVVGLSFNGLPVTRYGSAQ